MALGWLWVALPGLASRGFSHLALSVAPSSAICLPLPGCSIENSGIPGEIPCVHSQTRRMVDLQVRRLGLRYVLPAPTVSCRWLPGAAPAHLQRCRSAGPHLEAERALRDEDLQSVERARTVLSCGGEQRSGTRAIDHVDDIRILTDLIERRPKLVEPLRLTGRPF